MEREIDLCGFLVVRVAPLNFDAEGRGAFPAQPPRVGDVFYAGVDRMAWFDLDEEIISGAAPPSLATVRERVRRACHDLTGLELTRNLGDAIEIAAFCNATTPRCEIIGLWSPRLAEIKSFSMTTSATPLGYDPVSLGHGSLLREGLFARPELFGEFVEQLNADGLFPEMERAMVYVRRYIDLSRAGAVEPLISQPYGIDLLRVARVSPPLV
ncbi:MAG: hypothetical protein OZ948_18430 [Deltaproteobacteria bacterium]|nr:hypothetical protein [Deltaproteobacteria bacterium]